MYNGWLNIYKPVGISSAYVVSLVKNSLGKETKIGHCGTLDVEAEGVLPVAVGEARKLVSLLMEEKKTYIFALQFGAQTDTGDLAGKIIKTSEIIPNRQQLLDICQKFIGKIKQKPPVFSALKVNGKRSYKLALSNQAPSLPEREIEVYDLSMHFYDEKNALAIYEVTCSKGTYIRSLAEDIALSLKTYGFVVKLARIAVGSFFSYDSLEIDIDNLKKNIRRTCFLKDSNENHKIKSNFIKKYSDISLQNIFSKFFKNVIFKTDLSKSSFDEKTCWFYKDGEKNFYDFSLSDKLKPVSFVLEKMKIKSVAINLLEMQKILFGQKCFFNEPDSEIVWLCYNNLLIAIGQIKENLFYSKRVFNLYNLI